MYVTDSVCKGWTVHNSVDRQSQSPGRLPITRLHDRQLKRPANNPQQQQSVEQVDGQIRRMIPPGIEPSQSVVDRQRQVQQRPARNRASVAGRRERLAQRPKLPDGRILDDGAKVIVDERSGEAVGISGQPGNYDQHRRQERQPSQGRPAWFLLQPAGASPSSDRRLSQNRSPWCVTPADGSRTPVLDTTSIPTEACIGHPRPSGGWFEHSRDVHPTTNAATRERRGEKNCSIYPLYLSDPCPLRSVRSRPPVIGSDCRLPRQS